MRRLASEQDAVASMGNAALAAALAFAAAARAVEPLIGTSTSIYLVGRPRLLRRQRDRRRNRRDPSH
jgi:hypothetical protein